MSRLTQLYQRIKTVSTIKKTTHAMRLTSMSTHSRLQKKKQFLESYKQSIKNVLQQLGVLSEITEITTKGKHLIIIVGSQKGLCGVFNTRLMHLFEHDYPLKAKNKSYDLVTIGRKVREYLEQRKITPMTCYDNFNAANFVAVSHEIVDLIMTGEYKRVTIYSNHPRTFFLQESKSHKIHIPQKQVNPQHITKQDSEISYEQPPAELILHAETMYMEAYIEDLLFKSLTAEQAARFVSMDSSTRNAETLITDMKRDYNKLRQASITRELTDLAGGVL